MSEGVSSSLHTSTRPASLPPEILGLIGHVVIGRGTYWTLSPELHPKLAIPGHAERDRRIDWAAAKTRVLSVLMQRAIRGEPGLSNQEIRAISRTDRKQALRLMEELRREGHAVKPGERRWARWIYVKSSNGG